MGKLGGLGGFGGDGDGGLEERMRFAREVVRNLGAPEVVVEAGVEVKVEEAVSRVLAVR